MVANSYIPRNPHEKKKKNVGSLRQLSYCLTAKKRLCFYVISIRRYSISFPWILRSYPMNVDDFPKLCWITTGYIQSYAGHQQGS